MSKFCFAVLFLLFSCSGLEQSEREKMRKNNATGEFIYRKQNETFLSVEGNPHQRSRELYSWEKKRPGQLMKIVPALFYCRGSHQHPPKERKGKMELDCGGKEQHGLPLRGGREFIFPILVELLNYIQDKSGHKVILTSAYRCPVHNRYVDPSPKSALSKHLIAAEVDFYVHEMEETPQKVVQYLLQFFKEHPRYRGKREYQEFKRLQQSSQHPLDVWSNKEVIIKIYKKVEGRNFDNCHPFSYITIEVCYDRDREERVSLENRVIE